VLTLRGSESGTQRNIVQPVTITDESMVRLVKAATLEMKPGEL